LHEALEIPDRLTLEEAETALTAAGLEVVAGQIETLLGRLPGLSVVRPSLFEVYVTKEGTVLELEFPLVATKGKRSRGR
jgi:hypothetical protein